ncbi:hypothetical protein ONA70_24020 [Micromonospora yasonensis]|uniref:hypothetical protein n=1 Tax=Micromonospora yasonensis TaxID=1128667 RepID=UPI00222EFB97|nr:hypothetical protein [Micromonospora yasonensis]MCW3843173.1 hypothetical protein [Micromonospora yasonensis]
MSRLGGLMCLGLINLAASLALLWITRRQPRDSRQIRMSAVVGDDDKAQSRVGKGTAGMIMAMWLESR